MAAAALLGYAKPMPDYLNMGDAEFAKVPSADLRDGLTTARQRLDEALDRSPEDIDLVAVEAAMRVVQLAAAALRRRYRPSR